jgi:hypothetical protein
MEQRYGEVVGEERKLQATEMKFQRAVVTKARRDIIMLCYIRRELNMEEIQEHLDESRLTWS